MINSDQGVQVSNVAKFCAGKDIGMLMERAGLNERQALHMWWVLQGHKKFPGLPITLSESDKHELFENLTDHAAIGGLGLNRAFNVLWAFNDDLRSRFDITTSKGQIAAIAWFYTVGVPRFGLIACIDSRTRQRLVKAAFRDSATPISQLMVLAWLTVPALNSKFDLSNAGGREKYLQWFLAQGATMLGLAPLLDTAVQMSSPLAPICDSQGAAALQAHLRANTGVNLIGYAFGELGIGEDLRMAAQCCREAGIPFKVLNVNTGQQTRQADDWLAAEVVHSVDELPYRVNIFCLTGFATLKLYAECGRSLFAGRYNIGWWPWELPVWPAQWSIAFSVIDEIWAASRFARRMFSAATAKPVTHMPLAVCVKRIKKVRRRKLGLPSRRFLFLYIFDFNSYIARKNPLAVIEAFQEAYAIDDSVGLVLKTMNVPSDNSAWRVFVRRCASDPRIVLLQETLDRPSILGLIDACDAYVSLHRAEGFGRTLAEAILLRKPVVATNFSGNKDFLNVATGYPVKWRRKAVGPGEYPYIVPEDGAWWAEPDVSDAARQMRAAREAAGSEWAIQLPEQVGRKFLPRAIGRKMAAYLKVGKLISC